jgi:tRNA 2-thiouridine synthesizing protein A
MNAEPELAAENPVKRMLNCRGMRCPLPVIYTRRTLATMPDGDLLTVIATDPGSVADFAEYSRRGGMELVAHREDAGAYIFLVRKPRAGMDGAHDAGG